MTVDNVTTNQDCEDFEGNECLIFSYDHKYEALTVDYRNKSMDHMHISFSFDDTECKNLYHYLKNIYELKQNKITKLLKDFTEDELDDICHHYLCYECPLNVTGDSSFCPRRLLNHEITVKESDLKDG